MTALFVVIVFLGTIAFVVPLIFVASLFTPPSDQSMIEEIFPRNLPGLLKLNVIEQTINTGSYWKTIRIEAVLDTAQGPLPCTGQLTLQPDDPGGTQVSWDKSYCAQQHELIVASQRYVRYDLNDYSGDDQDQAVVHLLAHWVIQGTLNVEDIQSEMFRKEVTKVLASRTPK